MQKITPFVDYNFWLKHFDSQLNGPTKQNSMKILKVDKPTNIYFNFIIPVSLKMYLPYRQ